MFSKLNLQPGRTRMIKSLALATLCVHLISCLWYMSAEFYEFSPLTWVARRGL